MYLPLIGSATPDCPAVCGWWIHLVVGSWGDGSEKLEGTYWVDGNVR